MSESICKVSDVVFVRFQLIDLEPQKEYLNHFGMILAHETEDSIFFRGTGTAPYCYVATRGEKDRYIGTAYKVNHYEELEQLSERMGVKIEHNNEPGGGKKVVLTDPDGIQIEVYHGMTLNDPIDTAETVLNTGKRKNRTNELQRFGKADSEWQVHGDKWVYELTLKVKRLGHTAINCVDGKKSMKWYSNVLGFLVSDNVITPDGQIGGAFMRCNQGDMPVDHHTLNNIQLPGERPPGDNPTFGHAGYEVTDSVDDLMAGHYHMKTVDKYYHEWGVGRHLLGSQMYDYWRDPSGFTHEHWTDGDLLDESVEPGNPAFRELVMAQYGPEVPATFGLTMPSDEVDDFRSNNPKISDMIKEVETAQLK